MKKLACFLTVSMLAAGAAHGQPAAEAAADVPAAETAADAAVPAGPATPADPATPAEPATPAVAVTEAEIDSFAKATVKLQAIQADATIAAEAKQGAMQAAVTEAGLDPAKYNAIGKATQTDATLRARVQTAMSRYAGPPSG